MSPAPTAAQAAWLRLNVASAMGPDRLRGWVGRVGLERLSQAGPEELAAAGGLALEAARRLRDALDGFDLRREWESAQDLGLRILAWDEPEFPELLRSITDAPLVLYVWGRLDAGRDALAFVGSRQPTPYGRRMTRQLVREASARFVITSGLARGIDTRPIAPRWTPRGRPGRSWAADWGASILRRTRPWPRRSSPVAAA